MTLSPMFIDPGMSGSPVAPDVALLLLPELLLLCDAVQAVEDAAPFAAAFAGRHNRPAIVAPAWGPGAGPLGLSVGRFIECLRADATLAAGVADDFRAAQGLFETPTGRRPARALSWGRPRQTPTASGRDTPTEHQRCKAGSVYRF
jgi:hypothetical protein